MSVRKRTERLVEPNGPGVAAALVTADDGTHVAFERSRASGREFARDQTSADKGYQQPPYTTSKELLDYIRAEAGPPHEQLNVDPFEKISFYDNRVVEAKAVKRADGKYEVTLDLIAAKRYSDGLGKETDAAVDDWIEVGVFAASTDDGDGKVLYLERKHITEGAPKLTVVVDEEPSEAGFDPYNKLIDRVPADNRRRVQLL